MELSVQRSAKIKLDSFRKAVIVHQKFGTLFVIYKLKQESQIQKEKGEKQRRFKPFLLMNEEFCIQYKKINNIFNRL